GWGSPRGTPARAVEGARGGGGEGRAGGARAGARRDDRRGGVPGQRRPVPAVQVHVLVAVDVVDLGAPAVAEPHRLRGGDLPARGDSARQRVGCALGQAGRLRLALGEDLLLLGDDPLEVYRRAGRAVL